MVDITISIVNFNAEDNLRMCLDSIRENIRKIGYEVVVADNRSDDGSVSMVRERFPSARLIVNQQNLGATRAKNQTFQTASGRYILMLDSDVEILPGAVEAMFNFMEGNPKIGVLGPQVIFPNRRPQHSCNKTSPNLFSAFLNKFFFFSNLRYAFYRTALGARYLARRYARPGEFVWLGGMCLLVRREVIERLGGMDEHFFIYFDDTDFCLRAKKAGWKVYYLPSACVVHHMGKGVSQLRKELYVKIFEHELYFFKKHHGQLQSNVCAFMTQSGMLLRILLVYPLFFLRLTRDDPKRKIEAYWKVFCLAGRQLYGRAG